MESTLLENGALIRPPPFQGFQSLERFFNDQPEQGSPWFMVHVFGGTHPLAPYPFRWKREGETLNQ